MLCEIFTNALFISAFNRKHTSVKLHFSDVQTKTNISQITAVKNAYKTYRTRFKYYVFLLHRINLKNRKNKQNTIIHEENNKILIKNDENVIFNDKKAKIKKKRKDFCFNI